MKKTHVVKVFDSVEVAASGSATSTRVDLGYAAKEGYFSFQYAITGDGECKFEYLISHNDVDYIEPSSASDIGTGLSKTSGPGSDGKDVLSISPMLSPNIKFKCTETGGANSVTVSAWVAIQ